MPFAVLLKGMSHGETPPSACRLYPSMDIGAVELGLPNRTWYEVEDLGVARQTAGINYHNVRVIQQVQPRDIPVNTFSARQRRISRTYSLPIDAITALQNGTVTANDLSTILMTFTDGELEHAVTNAFTVATAKRGRATMTVSLNSEAFPRLIAFSAVQQLNHSQVIACLIHIALEQKGAIHAPAASA